MSSSEPGEVVEMVGKQVRVRLASGETRVCTVRTKVVVGDRVTVQYGSVTTCAPRQTELARSADHGPRVVCANATLLVSVSSATDPPFRPGLVDRVLVAASASRMRAALVLNKCDLGMPEDVLELLAKYEALGYPIFLVSAVQEKGLEPLRALLAEHTSVLVGHSGVGKSSLTMALIPGVTIDTGELDPWGRGRHTTIAARLFDIPTGGRLIDVPGIRDFGVGGIPREELKEHFPEFDGIVCKYRGCMHNGEDGCVADAHTWKDRMDSYQKLLSEVV